MNPVYWAWSAVVADIGLLLSPAILSTDVWLFWGMLWAHAVVSSVAAMATYLLLPRRFRVPRLPVTLLMFCFAFVAPAIGAVGLLVITRANLQQSVASARVAVPVSLELPVYDVQVKEHFRGSQGAIRSRLGQDVRSDLRMQSLLTLQAVPNRVSNPILEDLLGDDADDVRLVAFGMLDSEEKTISSQIRYESARLKQYLTAEQRFDALRHMAELNWELVYARLAQGELRAHILAQALEFADAALALGLPANAGLVFLRSRILFEQGSTDAAEQAVVQSMALGQSKTSALPYLAEIAFSRRDFVRVRQLMQQLSSLSLGSQTRAVEDFWVNRDNEINYSDRRYLPHI